MSYYKLNGHSKDPRYGYNFKEALPLTLLFLFLLLPFLNIFTLSGYFFLIRRKKIKIMKKKSFSEKYKSRKKRGVLKEKIPL